MKEKRNIWKNFKKMTLISQFPKELNDMIFQYYSQKRIEETSSSIRYYNDQGKIVFVKIKYSIS